MDTLNALKNKINNDDFAKMLGITIEEIDYGRAIGKMQISEKHLNFHGISHGGALFSLADQVFAAACNSYNFVAVALSVTINFFAPPPIGAILLAEAKEINRGRKTGTYQIEIYTEDKTQIAVFQGLAYIKKNNVIEDAS